MNPTIDQSTSVPSMPKRTFLANADRHERHSTSRQERALKTLRRMRRFDDGELLDGRRIHRISSADETLDD